MARTKQTPRQGSGSGRGGMVRAMLAAPATTGGPAPSMSAPTTSTSVDDGENVLRAWRRDAAKCQPVQVTFHRP